MHTRTFLPFARPSLCLVLLVAVLVVLWLAGGASRADEMGQAVARAAMWTALVVMILGGVRPALEDQRSVVILLGLMVAVPLLQSIPLPPALWQAFPGRGIVADAAIVSSVPQPWRPLSIVPGATLNAAASLIVPLVIFLLVAGVRRTERGMVPTLVLLLMFASTMVGLIQFSGNRFAQPLINYTFDVSGTFANRNHFAVFLAMGCLVAPAWACLERGQARLRGPVAGGLVALFILSILASGSRAGMAGAALAMLIVPLLIRENLRRGFSGRPRWLKFAVAGVALCLLSLCVGVSVATSRAVSVDRLIETDINQDMRVRGLKTVWEMVCEYFPIGTGLGSFDALFRMHEPFALLKPTYFNQAHNDYLQTVLDAGLVGLLLLIAALAWWARASVVVWCARGDPAVLLGRLGSAMLSLVWIASIVDYPARTPLFMATVVIAAMWLAHGSATAPRRSSLPQGARSI